MQIGIPREVYPGERRVAASPDSVKQFIKLGFTVAVESNAGQEANFADDVFQEAGAQIVPDAKSLFAQADIILKVPHNVLNAKHHEREAQ
ncbi:MAG: NAD(P)(+) transhydrogenase (Re/Si-specific) subunit alpha, partial [Magnetococcales bacterium]|nr:NAD(P)(+) transhydrogenase (Re/Si-specific) subunit alpha [Magnetococcales bacterium]